MSDHESFEKRGEIRFDADEWINWQQSRAQATAASSQASARRSQQKQQQQVKKQEPVIAYENTPLNPAATKKTLTDYVLNVRAPIPERDPREEEEEIFERDTDEDGEFTETEEEYQERLNEWKAERAEKHAQMTPGSVAFYQIKLKDESRGWEAMSSIKSVSCSSSVDHHHPSLSLPSPHPSV